MSELTDLFRELDGHYGSGETFSRQERELIETKVVPPWLLLGRRLLKGPDQVRCAKAVDALCGLHAAVAPKVEFRR